MSGDDKLNLDLNLAVDTKGVAKLEGVDKILDNIRKSLEAIVTTAKAAGGSLDTIVGRGTRKTGGSTASKAGTRSALEALAIDKDALRVVKMRMRYDKDAAAFKVRAAKQEQADAQRSFRDKLTFATRMATARAKADTAATRAIVAEQRLVERSYKAKLGFATRMASQRAREESSAERDIQRGIREPKRPKKEDESIHRYLDLTGVRVLSVCGEMKTITLALSAADHERINAAAREAVRVADHQRWSKVLSPVVTTDAGATLPVVANEILLEAGDVVDLRLGLKAYLKAEPVIVTAVLVKLDAVHQPKAKAARTPPSITLGGAS